MTQKMLIDATHPEETRVAIIDGSKIEDFDVETSIKKQIKSNIYLAKIVRVEPSLQAAFVDYGGNRHGFLAFNEIHPDYYQLPVADREKIKEEMLKAMAEEDEDDDDDEEEEAAEPVAEAREAPAEGAKEEEKEEEAIKPETVSDIDPDELFRIKHNYAKNYKIQEIIRKGQVILVQVVKEERGNKGAALTTYLSLAGRYCVLMPNNVKGGGISKKINSPADRKKLKTILNGLNIPGGMSVIVRTAGKDRTKAEIKRDYDFLIKNWMKVRDLTIKSTAPALILEEGDVIKRSLRDNYSKEISEIVIAGEESFKNAKEYIKMLSPGNVKKLKQYKGTDPIFSHYQIEGQLETVHSPYVQLKSGAYLVINQTEALVAIDVNSGRATKERSIEDTALKANLEAADEIARQLRLRDMAGLVVIDFIDMDEKRNNNAVERRMKEALKKDRARIQMGKISGFGLMELSRQRKHSSILESNYHSCPYCKGRGLIRSQESAGVYVLRIAEEEGVRGKAEEISIHLPTDLALYLLNKKRDNLIRIEEKYAMKVMIVGDDSLNSYLDYRLEKNRLKPNGQQKPENRQPVHEPEAEEEEDAPSEVEEEKEKLERPHAGREDGNRKRNGRNRRRRSKDRQHDNGNGNGNGNGSHQAPAPNAASEQPEEAKPEPVPEPRHQEPAPEARPAPEPEIVDDNQPKKTGWWSKLIAH